MTDPSAVNPGDAPSDAFLVESARTGDASAFAELWTRHSQAASRAAGQFRSVADPDDLVAEAYTRILQSIRNGKGPTGAFRPYLFVTVRNLASRIASSRKDEASDELDLVPDESTLADPAIVALDRSLTVRAFRSLPERWQTVLWYTAVEGMSPLEASTMVGLSANATAALALRAREGLRQAWIQAHISDESSSLECKWMLTRMGRYARHDLSARDRARAARHLSGCARCMIVSEEIDDLSSRLAIVVLPLVLGGAGGAAYLASLHSAGTAAQAAGTSASVAAGAQGTTIGGVPAVATTGGVSGWAVGAGIAATLVVGGGTWAGLATLTAPPEADGTTVAGPGREVAAAPDPAPPTPDPTAPQIPAPVPVPPVVPVPVPAPLPPPAVIPAEPEPAPAPAPVDPAPVDPDTTASPPSLSSPLPADDQPTAPRLTGAAEPGATVTVTDQDGAVVTTIVADDAGGWDSGELTGLPPTTTALAITQRDLAGNQSEPTAIGPFAFHPTLATPTETMTATAGVPFELELRGWAGEAVSIAIDGADYPGEWIFDSAGQQTRLVTLGTPGAHLITFRYLGADPATDTSVLVTAD